MNEPISVTLSKPINAHGKEVVELAFREPTADDVMQSGMPTLLIPSADGSSVGVEVRAGVIARYISRLAEIPLPSVKAMSVADFNKCTGVVMGFFGESDGEVTSSNSPPESSKSPTSGA